MASVSNTRRRPAPKRRYCWAPALARQPDCYQETDPPLPPARAPQGIPCPHPAIRRDLQRRQDLRHRRLAGDRAISACPLRRGSARLSEMGAGGLSLIAPVRVFERMWTPWGIQATDGLAIRLMNLQTQPFRAVAIGTAVGGGLFTVGQEVHQ